MCACAAELRGICGARLVAEVGRVVRRRHGLGLQTAAGVARRVKGRTTRARARALLESHGPRPCGGAARAILQLVDCKAAYEQLVPIGRGAEGRAHTTQPHAHHRGIGGGGKVAARKRRQVESTRHQLDDRGVGRGVGTVGRTW